MDGDFEAREQAADLFPAGEHLAQDLVARRSVVTVCREGLLLGIL